MSDRTTVRDLYPGVGESGVSDLVPTTTPWVVVVLLDIDHMYQKRTLLDRGPVVEWFLRRVSGLQLSDTYEYVSLVLEPACHGRAPVYESVLHDYKSPAPRVRCSVWFQWLELECQE